LPCEFSPLAWFLLNLHERLQLLSLFDEDFAQVDMDEGSLRVQVQSLLELGLGFIVSARLVQQGFQAQMRIGTKRVERSRLFLKLDCLVEIAQYRG
jgi:hypothetical protein